ncbi:MAG TPA: hypothetical protein VE553_04095 [Candidatus Binatia bacterium]|jgi:LPS sulfotransferase NodH|nr:hypothetical protein [Candidatus Binatia bacterium]
MPFGFYLRPQVTPFVILFIERDGSTYMIGMLESHPAIATVYERFAVMRQKGQDGAAQVNWAREFYSAPLVGSTAALGFKTKLVDVLDPSGFVALLREKRVNIIHMRRRNRVKAVVSRINARRLYEATGNWNLYKKSDRMPPMTIDPDMFATYLHEREEADDVLSAFVSDLQLPTFKVTYEELLVDREAMLTQIFAFLNVPPYPVQEKTIKHTKDDLRQVVKNFDELRAQYAGTPYHSMFDEILAPAAATLAR